jgi:4-carboxymuconolactone decarboxylase
MANTDMLPEQVLSAVAHEDLPVLDTVFHMHLASMESCDLDARTFHLVRLAALVAADAPPASYLVHLPMAADAGVSLEDAQGVFVAIAPLVGTPKVTAAAGNVLRALGMAEALDSE